MYTPSFPSISFRRHTASAFTLVVLLTVMLIPPLPAFGQADVSTGTLKGSILDQNGENLAGAAVTVTDLNRGITRTATSNSDGVYQVPLLQPGRYQLQVEAQGFAKSLIKGIELTVGQIVVYDVKLNVGTVTSEIVVSAEPPLIQIEQTQQANTINQSQIEALPNINRNMTAAVFTLPGVASSEATRTQQPGFTGFATTGFSIGGSNGRNNLSTIDGGENEYGSGQYRVFIPVDSIQEFQVNRNSFAAEFGFTVGSSVNIVTKSGSNQYHGSAYGYYRNNSTQAVNFIDQLRTGQEPYSQNVNSGVTAGGPIVKGKLFFFTTYE